MSKEFTDSNFETEVLNSETLVMVDFWAVWCGPCKTLSPIIDELSTEYVEKVKIGKLNVDENSEISTKYGIRSVPTLLFFKNGEIIDKKVGAVSKTSLQEKINSIILS